jgi:hypothetical protein
MLELNGIRCWIEDGETKQPFPEYGTKVKGRTITAFIESNVGRAFTVNYSYNKKTMTQQAHRLYLGEMRVRGDAYERLIGGPRGVKILGDSLPDGKVQSFQFQSKTIEGTRLSFEFPVYHV